MTPETRQKLATRAACDAVEAAFRQDHVAHRRYDSDEFAYSGCVVCDVNGDSLGWPCPTVRDAS